MHPNQHPNDGATHHFNLLAKYLYTDSVQSNGYLKDPQRSIDRLLIKNRADEFVSNDKETLDHEFKSLPGSQLASAEEGVGYLLLQSIGNSFARNILATWCRVFDTYPELPDLTRMSYLAYHKNGETHVIFAIAYIAAHIVYNEGEQLIHGKDIDRQLINTFKTYDLAESFNTSAMCKFFFEQPEAEALRSNSMVIFCDITVPKNVDQFDLLPCSFSIQGEIRQHDRVVSAESIGDIYQDIISPREECLKLLHTSLLPDSSPATDKAIELMFQKESIAERGLEVCRDDCQGAQSMLYTLSRYLGGERFHYEEDVENLLALLVISPLDKQAWRVPAFSYLLARAIQIRAGRGAVTQAIPERKEPSGLSKVWEVLPGSTADVSIHSQLSSTKSNPECLEIAETLWKSAGSFEHLNKSFYKSLLKQFCTTGNFDIPAKYLYTDSSQRGEGLKDPIRFFKNNQLTMQGFSTSQAIPKAVDKAFNMFPGVHLSDQDTQNGYFMLQVLPNMIFEVLSFSLLKKHPESEVVERLKVVSATGIAHSERQLHQSTITQVMLCYDTSDIKAAAISDGVSRVMKVLNDDRLTLSSTPEELKRIIAKQVLESYPKGLFICVAQANLREHTTSDSLINIAYSAQAVNLFDNDETQANNRALAKAFSKGLATKDKMLRIDRQLGFLLGSSDSESYLMLRRHFDELGAHKTDDAFSLSEHVLEAIAVLQHYWQRQCITMESDINKLAFLLMEQSQSGSLLRDPNFLYLLARGIQLQNDYKRTIKEEKPDSSIYDFVPMIPYITLTTQSIHANLSDHLANPEALAIAKEITSSDCSFDSLTSNVYSQLCAKYAPIKMQAIELEGPAIAVVGEPEERSGPLEESKKPR